MVPERGVELHICVEKRFVGQLELEPIVLWRPAVVDVIARHQCEVERKLLAPRLHPGRDVMLRPTAAPESPMTAKRSEPAFRGRRTCVWSMTEPEIVRAPALPPERFLLRHRHRARRRDGGGNQDGRASREHRRTQAADGFVAQGVSGGRTANNCCSRESRAVGSTSIENTSSKPE